jgi:hypothetical protein
MTVGGTFPAMNRIRNQGAMLSLQKQDNYRVTWVRDKWS